MEMRDGTEGWEVARPAGQLESMEELRFGGGGLSAHLLHELAHGGDVTRVAAFLPGFIALGGLFEVAKEVLVHKTLAECWNDGL